VTASCEPMDVARKHAKDKRRQQRKCFWSWPFGHCFHTQMTDDLTYWSKCCRCEKRHVSPPPRMAIPLADAPEDW
jgi:hypothetical protein